ncbi:TPA: hypothetical protein ACOJPC_002310 [Vibrio fluvialis]|uniref:hypothetical protein n=1 Tax=Vibrio fluvialis TaxID=676 RepID=UPI0029868084|nr:hypothetical protein [Vibrio fluvialis]EKO3457997.1 hypothetical protein [Vibrio fluvialis]EKO3996547.1 hypothetical protein [Vibrio fluvialis]
MNKIDLTELFISIKNQPYVVIKSSNELPFIKSGSDVDIFCLDLEEMTKNILAFLNGFIKDNYRIRVTTNLNHRYVDLLDKESIIARFDLYGELPVFENLSLKSSFFLSVIEGAIVNDKHIKVTKDIDDYILRYCEYIEYYATRPDKIKHIDFINDNYDDKIKSDALTKLYYFTSFKLPNVLHTKTKYQVFAEWINHIVSRASRFFYLIKQYGLLYVINLIRIRLFK